MENQGQQVRRRRVVTAAVGACLVALLVLTGVLYRENRDLKDASAQGPASAKEESRRLTDKVARLIQVPGNETATVATVRDRQRLKRQRFFRDVKNGDKVLIFTKAKRVVVYREQDNLIVNVGPVVVGGRSGKASTTKREKAAAKKKARTTTSP